MNDTEEAVRHLFTVAAEDLPPGIDLLRGVRARGRTRVLRLRAVAAMAAAATVITRGAVPASSAFAQVKHAAAAGQPDVHSASRVTPAAPMSSVGPPRYTGCWP
jgi:hypothetical protein